MEYYALSIANEFIDIAQQEGVSLTPLGLMKRCYIAHGFMLAILNQNTEGTKLDRVQAWKYGPVFPSIYYQFNKYGNKPITEKCSVNELSEDQNGECTFLKITPTLQNEEKQLVCKAVWDRYKDATPSELVHILHAPGTPWHRVYEEGKNNEIPDSYTKEYYDILLSKIREYAREHKPA